MARQVGFSYQGPAAPRLGAYAETQAWWHNDSMSATVEDAVSQKPPPPMFSRSESIKLFVTPKMLKAVAVVTGLLIGLPGAGALIHPEPPKAGPIPVPIPVSTTEAQGWSIPTLFGTLPPPDPRQKNAVCRKALGQYMLKGACWQRIPVDPPCPVADGAFEHDEDHKCYVPVLRAERPKQSGEPQVVNIAGEE